MTFWEILFWVWVIGMIIAWPIIARWIYRHEDGDFDSVEVAMLIGVAMTIAPFWPLIIPGYWVYEFATN